MVTRGFKKASIFPLEVLVFEKVKENKCFPFISTYNSNNPNLLPLIRKTFKILQQGTIKRQFVN